MQTRCVQVAVALCVGSMSAMAQGADPRAVMPERPTVATHAGTIAPGFLEIEWGAELSAGPSLAIPAYFKLGITKQTQLGFLVPISKVHGTDVAFDDLMVALKWRVADGSPVLGDFAIQPGVTLPTQGGNSRVNLLFISSRQLGKVAMDLNVGLTAASGAGLMESWTASFGGPLSGKWGWVGELSGALTSGSSTSQLLFGPTYRLHKWFSFDGGVIVPINPGNDARYYFGGVTNVGRIFGK